MPRLPPCSTLFPYTTLFRSVRQHERRADGAGLRRRGAGGEAAAPRRSRQRDRLRSRRRPALREAAAGRVVSRSEEHTSELQSHHDLVCRLLLEKKKKKKNNR